MGGVLSGISLKKRTNVSFLYFFVGFGFLDSLDIGMYLEGKVSLTFSLKKRTNVSFFLFL